MTRILALILASLILGSPVQAAEKKAKETSSETAAPKPRTEAEQKKLDETRKRAAEKKVELNGSSWEMVLSPMNPKDKGGKDTFTFQDGQFSSKSLTGRGFAKTNYTITVPPGESDAAVWETMQTGKEGTIFIRGEWVKESMSGSISEQLDGGKKTREYSFSTSSRKAISPTSAEPEKEGAPAAGKAAADPSKALVSKESKKGAVAAFKPGSTEEATQA